MSHIPERKEKDCLSCGTIVQGKYCQNCGQENVVPHETFWHMVTHFFYDITHFDTNFFSTVHHLILRPGFLSTEYIKGRRSKYLHPIRMYVFSSAIFFLLFFSFFAPDIKVNEDLNKPASAKERTGFIKMLQNDLKKDTANAKAKKYLALAADTGKVVTSMDIMNYINGDPELRFGSNNYYSWNEYDSVQHLLPVEKRDGWMKRKVMKVQIGLSSEYRKDPKGTVKKFENSFLHRLPYMLFISLPLFALILRLVYIRRKQFYYADHGVFTIHLYIFTFILLLTAFCIGAIQDATGLEDLDYVVLALVLALFFYLYKAMRNFYGQRRAKTFLKFLLVFFLSIIMMAILFAVFLLFSAVTF